MREIDVKAFHSEAASQKAYLLLRKPNPEARKYIGQPGFAPKPFDCKFKPAEQDFVHEKLRKKLTVGGLVVNPTLDEFHKAFKSKKSFETAVKLWNEHRAIVSDAPSYTANGKRAAHFLPGAKQLMVNSDTNSRFFGCVLHSRISHTSHANYFHSDYDLYAYIPTSNAKSVQSFLSQLYNAPHYHEVNFINYQHRLNRSMGVPMIQHAPQELTGQHIDGQVFVFMPDTRTIFLLANQLEIREFYRDTLAGRRLSSH
ncbi:MAG TPA: hypothetical protein VIM41_15235 [Gammaproteobacteria bacterium]